MYVQYTILYVQDSKSATWNLQGSRIAILYVQYSRIDILYVQDTILYVHEKFIFRELFQCMSSPELRGNPINLQCGIKASVEQINGGAQDVIVDRYEDFSRHSDEADP